MKRRKVLVSSIPILSVISGCLGKAAIGGGHKSKDKTMVNKDDFVRVVSIKQVDSVPERFSVDITIELTQAEITDRQTAHLKTTVTNTGNKARKFDVPYYKGASSNAGKPGILLYSLSAPDSPSAQYAPECIGTDGKSQKDLKWSNEVSKMVTIDPKKSSSEELIIVDDPTTRGCIPTGEYRFETQYNISSLTGEESQFSWGFTLKVDEKNI